MITCPLALFLAVVAAPDSTLRAGPATPVAPQCARAGRRLQRQPACAFGRRVYLVVWSDGTRQVDRPTADIYCARVDAKTGRSLDPAGLRICSAADLQEYPAVAFDGRQFLVVWQDRRGGKDYDVYATRVTEDGRVLDPDGFAVVRRPANQARPAVAFAAGRFLVVWMDARAYPVYGLYAARVSSEAKVLDPGGRLLAAEDPAAIAKARPGRPSWLGEKHYWWQRLSSRYQPQIAVGTNACLVTYLREVHANRTTGWAVLVDAAKCARLGEPVQLPGEPRDRVAACATHDGWVVAFDHWLSGWTPAPRLAAIRLADDGRPRDVLAKRPAGRGAKSPPFLMDFQRSLAGDGRLYHQGKGHFAFWQAAAAWNGKHVVCAMDFAWRRRRQVNELHYVVAAARLDVRSGRFVDERPVVLASGTTKSGVCVRNPVLAAGPAGQTLLAYEKDAGIDRSTVDCRLLSEGR